MDQARSHLSPKGGQSPAVFAGDWPPSGAPACGNADAEGEAGYATGYGALAHLWRSFGAPLADPPRRLVSGRMRSSSQWAGQGCGACQRSSKRRRSFHVDDNSSGPGGAVQRELSGRIVAGW